uniref:Fibrohexamerin n=1 Tax=Haritalodes derogata TaxID=517475 RepID=A0A1V0PND8_HARDE|nr:low molecular weight silk protein P25 [Haritalodes derogata]
MLGKAIILAVVFNVCWAGAARKGIVRPCRLNDYTCIGQNFAANSKCSKKVLGSIPGEYILNDIRFETPYFNSSYIDNTLIVRRHNKCYVSEFFFNVDKDTSVITVDCPWLDLESNRTLIQHYTKREDTEYNYHIRGEYPLIRLTANLKHADKLDVCNGYVLADVTALPIFKVDPLDKPTERFLSHDLSFLNIYERETFFYRGRHLFRYFINAYICDFGCY